jgi:acetate kinase
MILTVNGGSSTIKCALFAQDDGPGPVATLDDTLPDGGPDAAVATVLSWLSAHGAPADVQIVVHRVVHGGERFEHACRVTPEVLSALDGLAPLAPNHLPGEIAVMRASMRALPGATHVACFDTAFHRTLPDVARVLPLPGARRYGFHGLSYTYLLSELERLAGAEAARGRVILAHLGSGASLAAVKDGRSVDTTMGMTPAGGLVMSTRSGDLDPGAVAHVMQVQGWSPADMDSAVTKHSGLLAISGRTGDMQELLALEASDEAAALAVRVFCYQVSKWMGALTVALGGLDTVVFSGGIGEHASEVRSRMAQAISCLGLALDADANARHADVISTTGSRVTARVIPTNEALVMARQATDLLRSEKGNTP